MKQIFLIGNIGTSEIIILFIIGVLIVYGFSRMKGNKMQAGIIVMILGIAAIIISQTVSFNEKTYEPTGFGGYNFTVIKENTQFKNSVLYGGVALFVLGGVLLATGLTKKDN